MYANILNEWILFDMKKMWIIFFVMDWVDFKTDIFSHAFLFRFVFFGERGSNLGSQSVSQFLSYASWAP